MCFCGSSSWPKQDVWTGFFSGPRILLWHFSGLKSPGKRLLVLEKSENLLNPRSKKKQNKKYLPAALRSWVNVNYGVLEKPVRVLEKSWKMVSENRYEQCVNDYIASVIQLHAYV